MKFAAPPPPQVEINLTSLIDILFIVLLFLVMTATFADRAFVHVTLPSAATGETQPPRPNVRRVVMDAEGALFLDRDPVTLAELQGRLQDVPAPGQVTVVLTADAGARHGAVIAVMDVVRQAGIVRLDIETRSPGPD